MPVSTTSRCPCSTRRRTSREHRLGAAAPRGAAHERDHAEVAREAAAVLHLDERAHAVEPSVRLDAADRADVAGDERRRLLAPPRDDDDVLGQPGERVAGEVRAAAGDVDAPMRARGARRRLAGLRTASCVTQHVLTTATSAAVALLVAVAEQRARASRARPTCETLQPRKRTENVATAARMLLARVKRSAAHALALAALDVRRSRRRRGSSGSR